MTMLDFFPQTTVCLSVVDDPSVNVRSARTNGRRCLSRFDQSSTSRGWCARVTMTFIIIIIRRRSHSV